MKHPAGLVARIKAACQAGIPTKVVASTTGVPVYTVRSIMCNRMRVEVEADQNFANLLSRLMREGVAA